MLLKGTDWVDATYFILCHYTCLISSVADILEDLNSESCYLTLSFSNIYGKKTIPLYNISNLYDRKMNLQSKLAFIWKLFANQITVKLLNQDTMIESNQIAATVFIFRFVLYISMITLLAHFIKLHFVSAGLT